MDSTSSRRSQWSQALLSLGALVFGIAAFFLLFALWREFGHHGVVRWGVGAGALGAAAISLAFWQRERRYRRMRADTDAYAEWVRRRR